MSYALHRHAFGPRALAIACVLACLGSTAGAVQPVRDINPKPLGNSNPPLGWYAIGSTLLFVLDDNVHGEELWRTDGTVTGTQLVKDINPGPAGSAPYAMTVSGGLLYFLADDGTNGMELWRSDGTTAGTHIVADVNAGPAGVDAALSAMRPLLAVSGVLYFSGSDATHGNQLWRSDGTAGGTYALTTLAQTPGVSGDVGYEIVAVGSRVFFDAADSAGSELWTTDGTVAGTHRVADIKPGAGSSSPMYLTPTSAGLYFYASDDAHGGELWFAKADGSGASLVRDQSPGQLVTEIRRIMPFGADVILSAAVNGVANPNPSGPAPALYQLYRASSSGTVTQLSSISFSAGIDAVDGYASFGGRLLLQMSTSGPAPVLWSTDGTAAGTQALGPGGRLYAQTFPQPSGHYGLVGSDAVYFPGYAGSPGASEIWRSDGTPSGTYRYAAYPSSFYTSDMAQFSGRIWLTALSLPDTGAEPWVSDGTPGGTALFADLNPGSGYSNPYGYAVIANRLFFFAGSDTSGIAPWFSDGTVGGTVNLRPAGGFTSTQDANPQRGIALGNRLVFSADDDTHLNQPWVTDGTTAGTLRLLNGNGGFLFFMGVAGGKVLFAYNDGVLGDELWATDGTPAGTQLVRDIAPGSAGSSISSFPNAVAVLNGIAYFSADDGVHGAEPWRSDGTPAGTYLVDDVIPGSGASRPFDMHVIANRLYFQATEGSDRYWWSTDGTASGTQRVPTGAAAIAVSSLDAAVLNGFLYFGGQGTPVVGSTHAQLWRTDGTAAGTQLVADPAPASGYAAVEQFQTLGNRLLFHYCGPTVPPGCSAYSSDGTGAGTVSNSSESVGNGVALGSLYYYSVSAGANIVLRVTDGTAAGTRDVLSAPLSSGEDFGSFWIVQGHVVFLRLHPVLGPSLWRTDGTVAGTKLVADIDPGTSTDYDPYVIGTAGGTTYLSAYTPQAGRELFALNPSGPNAGDDGANARAGVAETIAVLANDGAVVSDIDPTSIQIQTQPANGSVSVDRAAGKVVYIANAGFSGVDRFTYTVADGQAHASNAANVWMTVAQSVGPSPGTEPPAPSGGGSGSTSGGGGGSGSSSGGGGAAGALECAVLGLLAVAQLCRRRLRNRRYLRADAGGITTVLSTASLI